MLAAKSLPPAQWLSTALMVLLILYAACTIAMPTVQDGVNYQDVVQRKAFFTDGAFLLLMGVGTFYTFVWGVLVLVFLAWYAALLDWARGREATTVSTGPAVAFWFVPFVNLVHPYRTLKAIDQRLGVRAGVSAWWFTYMASLALGFGESILRPLGRSFGGLPVIAAAVEIGAVALCGRLVQQFTAFAASENSFTAGPPPG